MTALSKIQSAGFILSLVDGRLDVTPTKQPLTDTLRAYIREHKNEIISQLSSIKAVQSNELLENLREQIEERAAIMEYDGGLSRHDAEQEATKAIRVYCYRVKEKPDSELVVIMPNTSLAEAHESLSLRFGDKLLAVYENTPNLDRILAKPTFQE